jgi:hypothetical protein
LRKTFTIPVCKGCNLPVTASVRKDFSCMCQHNYGEVWVEVETVVGKPEFELGICSSCGRDTFVILPSRRCCQCVIDAECVGREWKRDV